MNQRKKNIDNSQTWLFRIFNWWYHWIFHEKISLESAVRGARFSSDINKFDLPAATKKETDTGNARYRREQSRKIVLKFPSHIAEWTRNERKESDERRSEKFIVAFTTFSLHILLAAGRSSRQSSWWFACDKLWIKVGTQQDEDRSFETFGFPVCCFRQNFW